MRKLLSILVLFILIFSCKQQNKKPRPDLSQTINYLSSNLTNGTKVVGYSIIERSISFKLNEGKIIYRTELIDSDNNNHWEMIQKFSPQDISNIRTTSFNSIKSIVLDLKTRSNHRITTSLNKKPIPRDIPVDEMIKSVFVTVEPNKLEGVKKAFENLSKLKKEENGADYFEN